MKYKLQLCPFVSTYRTDFLYPLFWSLLQFILSGVCRDTFSHGPKDLLFSQQDEATEQLAKSGYVFGAHAEGNAMRDKDKRIPKTKRMYSDAVRRWMEWVVTCLSRRIARRVRCWLALRFVEQNRIKDYKSGPGCATPDYKLLKEVFRWYGHTARGKKSKNGRPVIISFLNCTESLFGRFEEELQIKIVMEDRSEIYNVSFC